MIKAIIVDDEPHCINRLYNLVAEYCNNSIEIVGAFETVDDGISAIKNLKPDLVFLDVQIHDNTGFELLAAFTEIFFEVIFVTAYEKYAVQAFKFSAIDYLLKPVDPDDLLKAIGKLETKISKDDTAARFEVLFHNLKNLQTASKRICVPVMNGLVFLQVNDIIRCQSDVNYTTIFTKDKQKLVVAKTLKEFEVMLTDYQFFRVHNTHLINLNYIKSYNKGKGGFVTMLDNSDIEVSTRRKDDFLKRLADL